VLLAIVALAGALALVVAGWASGGAFSSGASRIPKRFEVIDVADEGLPLETQRLIASLSEKLVRLGFARADHPARVPAFDGLGRQLSLVPFAHAAEGALFLMGVEARLPGRAELMLHIITPLTRGRRIETSTLGALQLIRPPGAVDLRVVLDAGSVEEIWSRHRRALTCYERGERETVAPAEWRVLAGAAYEAWVEAALRAQRLKLTGDGHCYRLRLPG